MADLTPEQSRDLDIARGLAEFGIPIFVAPDGWPEKPSAAMKAWQQTKPNPRYVDAWRPGKRLCAVMGHGLDLVDLDPRNGGDATKLNGAMPTTYAVAATPSEGWHGFVKSMGVGSRDKVLPGIDVKAGTGNNDHGFAFIAPTVRASKVTGELVPYRWVLEPDLDRLKAAADDHSGEKLAEMVRQARGAGKSGEEDGGFAPSPLDDIDKTIAENTRHNAVVKLACALRGQGNWKLREAMTFLREVAYPKLDQAAGGHPYTLAEFENDVANVWKGYPDGPTVRASNGPTVIVEGEPVPSDPEADLANGRLLAATYGDRLRYVVPWKKWLCWDGARWKIDETGEAVRCAKAVADTLPKLAKGSPSRTQTSAGINAMLTMASTEPGIALSQTQLDADPYLLNCRNGTLDLRTGQLRQHDRDDLLTKVCGAAYRADAQAPEFVRFLERVQPDADMRDFLARLFGHALLGKVIEHLLAVFYGIGANGKTTLVEAVVNALGDYADTIEPGLLIDRGEVHPTGVADLFKLRLAITHETDEGRRLAEGTVKRLTGGDRVKARRMREDFWSFDPSHSIVMHTNHKPVVRGTDEGIWRRLRFVPFDVVIPEDERDGKLPERLALEADGILAWMVAGFRQWQDRGLADPQAVTDATRSFRNESDLLALFLDERTMQNPHMHVRSSELFEAWVGWAKRENVDAGTQTAFSRKLTERGFDKEKRRIGAVWLGIGLYTDETEPV